MNSPIRPEQHQQATRFEHDDATTAHSSLRLPVAPRLVMLHATQPPSWVSGQVEGDVDESYLSPEETSQGDYDSSFSESEFALPTRARRGSFATHLRAAMTGTAAVVAIWVGLIVFPNTARDEIWSRSVSVAPSPAMLPPSALRPSQGAQIARAAPSQVAPATDVIAQHDVSAQLQDSRPVDQPLQRQAQPQAQSPGYLQQQSVPQQRVVAPQPPQQPLQPHPNLGQEISRSGRHRDCASHL
jgi:hypothetical protein